MPERVARILPERGRTPDVRQLCHSVARIQLNNIISIIVLEFGAQRV
jgi:hypothetical protein